MGAWITLIGQYLDTAEKLRKFQSVFSVEGVPTLYVQEIEHKKQTARTFLWGWGNNGENDLQIVEDGNQVLLLHGVITGMGKYGNAPDYPRDTALRVLKLWKDYNQDVINELNGSFVCQFYNKESGELKIFVDRYASRPLWYTEEKNGFLVGNFPSAIAVMKTNPLMINPAGLWSLLYTARHVGNQGLYKDFYCLMAGQKLFRDSRGSLTVENWWRRKFHPQEGISDREWGKLLAEALKQSAVQYMKRCTKPYLFLSGGLDSRVAAAAIGKPLHAISLCTMPNAETNIASYVSKVLDIEHGIIVRSPYWYLDTLDAASLISSGNYLSVNTHFIVPATVIARQEEQAQFFLGDLLENFNKHYFRNIETSLPKFDPETIEDFWRTSNIAATVKDFERMGTFFRQDLRSGFREMYGAVLKGYARSVCDVSDDDGDRYDTFFRWANVGITYTYNMLTCFHPIAEERNIRFDNKLDDLFSTIPSHVRGRGRLHKWILFSLNGTLSFIPNVNTFLPPIMPESLGSFAKKVRPYIGQLRRKGMKLFTEKPVLNTSGSWVLLHEMYRKDTRYRTRIEDILFNSDSFPEEIFDQQEIKKTWEEFIKGNIDFFHDVKALLSFGALQRLIPADGISSR
jgi:hypothetical protein